MKFIPIARVQLDEEELDAAVAVLRSGYLVGGSTVEEFERHFARTVGARYAVAVSSGTAALHVSYLALIKPGDEVLVPGFTHISTASMVHFAGGTPILCDVDRRTFTLSADDAASKITCRTAAIVPVHLFGNACDIEAVNQIATQHCLKVIWDACQAHATRYRGSNIGGFGDAVVYSFYPTKNITTAEGGMIVMGDRQLYERCRLLRNHGESRRYFHESFGLNYRMTELSGALGLGQLNKLPGFTAKRRSNAAYLTKRLGAVDGIAVPYVADGVEHSFHQFSILLEIERLRGTRDDFVEGLRKKGVEAAIHYPRALNQQPVFAERAVRLPNCEWLSARIVSLPVHPRLSDADLDQVAGAVIEVTAGMQRAV
ncbi:MAG TPA: DegT/DnrJ/EryC1/StrS aminotransferase family protein [Candidatus Binataceae bacterium]|nr:DegT/DnrJ/EryC1/StrS aminotransferase family protein [Candidatus Binataceae bacterium]